MTDTESRLLAAGDALADAAMALRETCERVGKPYPKFWAAREREWRALAREVRKEKGDGA